MTHPRIDAFDALATPPQSAAALGYRMPAEWEPHACIWLTRPHNEETWPGCMGQAIAQFDAWVEAMTPYVPVSMTSELGIATNDSWIRDYGPIFVVRGSPKSKVQSPKSEEEVRGQGQGSAASPTLDFGQGTLDSPPPPLAAHDFRFNGWGGKYEQRDLDDVVPQHVARLLGLPLWVHDTVLEGGSIEVNGHGTVMTTEQCLLNPNRNPGLTRDAIERELHDALGTTHAIWLPGGIVGDDTDGHIDDIARFTAPDTVLANRAPVGHPDHDVLSRNFDVLQTARDQAGRKLTVVELPVPEPILYDFPADRFGPGGVNPVPASYANFLISNGAVFVPVFGQAGDESALRIIEQALPGRAVVPVRSEHLVVGLGALHCLSQQQPIG